MTGYTHRGRASARIVAAGAVGLLAAGALTACGTGPGTGGTADADDAADRTLTVYAAASLTSTFEQIAEEFEATHDGVDVELSFAGSSDLVAQIQQGAPADVFASADTANMDKIVTDDLQAGTPTDFASNTLMIAVPPGNPAGVASLAGLAGDDVHLVVCAPEVPCGAATERVEEAAGLTFSPVSEEQSVTDVLNKVITGEADAGLVYVTDVRGAGDKVEGIEFPESESAVNVYPIAALERSAEPELAQEFVDAVLGQEGQQVLGDAGFAAP
ncbi:molybdate ABC transporter substrate-binding protein [Promicromonospora sukumoe]|uniref:molybdate ABC transporter substrate-binding protein n=1 Tax=Promicromonospora sukumoe TaxID=88382 RepID=UPI000361D66D|nr:molybdate ABC transporter substrate-binding protein [Promicromonospora sukumoe]